MELSSLRYPHPSLLHISESCSNVTFLMTLSMTTLFKTITNFQLQHYQYPPPYPCFTVHFPYKTLLACSGLIFNYCLLTALSHYASYGQIFNPMDWSPLDCVHGVSQAQMLKWIATSFSRRSSWPRDQTQVSSIAGRFFSIWATSVHGLTFVPLCFIWAFSVFCFLFYYYYY